MSQAVVIDTRPSSAPTGQSKRTVDRLATLLAQGEAHLENNQFAAALECFELALCFDSKNQQAQLGLNRAHCQIVPRWHFEMLNDEKRNEAFRRAIVNAITPETIASACESIRNDVHQVQPAAISITNATEYGLAYRAAEVAAIGDFARSRGLALHMDGARLANALVSTGDSLADVTWRAGVDALSFGFVKNGGLNAEALILFRTELADEIAVRRKRAGRGA